ncbi:sugar-transfer associated ATP-grasp domain-containing protein, partial [Paenibacillus sp.]
TAWPPTYFNNLIMRRAYGDKCMYSKILRDVKKPETIVKNIATYFYDGDGDHMITRAEAIRLCESEEHLIFKPSLDSAGGHGISFYDRDDKNSPRIEDLFEEFGVNFVVQRLVKQHPDLAKIHASSLNTVRVMSFHFQGEVHILSAQLRMGGGAARIDNISAGGCACAIKPDGWLYEKSVTRKSEWTDTHSSGIKFKDIRVPNYEGILATAKRLHCELPYYNIIGWDFAVDVDGNPVFMEFNIMPEQNQIGSAMPAFGDLTETVLEEVFIKKTLKEAFD